MIITLQKLIEIAEHRMYNDYKINLGMERKVVVRERDDRRYIYIQCFTLSGNFKGSYKCGSIDANSRYILGKYDDIDLTEKYRKDLTSEDIIPCFDLK